MKEHDAAGRAAGAEDDLGCQACSLHPLRASLDGPGVQAAPRLSPASQPSIGVAVVDSDPRTHQLMEQVFRQGEGFHSCGFFATASGALQRLSGVEVQLLLVEARLPDLCGVNCACQLLRHHPQMGTVLMTSVRAARVLEHAFIAGIHQCLIKPFHLEQCLATLRFVSRRINAPPSEMPQSATAFGPVVSNLCPESMTRPGLRLSDREEQILACLAEGLLYKEIQDRLGVGPAVLKKLQHRIFRKLAAGNRTEAVNRWRHLSSQDR